MGFNKRIISVNKLLDYYSQSKDSNDIIKLFNADAIIYSGENKEKIYEIEKAVNQKSSEKLSELLNNLYLYKTND